MSLVNDMLRDLDARRRDAPTRGLGAEKLVPATEQGAMQSRRRPLLWIAVIVMLAALALFVFYLAPIGNGESGTLAPVRVAPMAQTEQVPNTSDITDDAEENSEEAVAQLAALEDRLQRLEAQNQALLLTQQVSEQQTSTQQTAAQQTATQQTSAGIPTAPVTDWQARDWSQQNQNSATPAINQSQLQAQAQTQQAGSSVTSAPSPSAQAEPASASDQSGSSSSRSPREMSFQDQDRQQVQQALRQWSSGQQLAALQTLDSFTYENPEAHQSRETLAKLLIEQGETERALQAVELGLGIAPRHDGYRKIKARLLLADGQAAQAVALLDASAPSVAADTEFHDLLATAYLSQQNYDRAILAYQMLLQQNQDVGRWWYGLGVSFDAVGRSADAASAYQQALQTSDMTATLRQRSQDRLLALRQTARD